MNGHILNIVREMYADNFRPDYVVGIVRGGAVPALHISHLLDVSCKMINVKIAGNKEFHGFKFIVDEIVRHNKNILIIDDINDTGKTLNDFKEKYGKHQDFKYAVLVDNAGSCFETDFAGHYINKLEVPDWIVFPWEVWWN